MSGSGSTQAQVPPTPAEIAAYQGLHAAAQRGDAAEIQRLAGGAGGARQAPTPSGSAPSGPGQAPRHAGANAAALEARDSNGRTPLHVATFAKRRDAIRALLTAGADSGALDRDRYDAVTIASVADDEETLRTLLAAGASAKLVTSRYEGTALIAAAHLGHDGVVRQLIAAGAPLDHVNNLGWTALIEAVVLGDGGPRHQACVDALLSAGADRLIGDRARRTPLQLAQDRGYAAIVSLLERPAAPRR
ncbi:MAG: ankyrin repeat domain-containing protein [Caldimonas sp.]